MMTWDWFDEYEWRARQSGDDKCIRLGELHRDAYRFRESDPNHALALLVQGRSLAEVLQEPWWMLYYDQQKIHALLHFKQDYRHVLEQAVRNVLESRKPIYAGFPRRLMIHGDLVSAYLGIDPLGYADPIRQALDYLDAETPAQGDERYLLLGNQRQFALEGDCLDEAERFSLCSLELAAMDPDRSRARHFLVFTYSGLAEIAFRRGDERGLADSARAGEEQAQIVGHQIELAGFWLWQAFLARRAGDEKRAASLYKQAQGRFRRLQMPPDTSYRDAECAFHELANRLDLALAVRETELACLRDRGRLWAECRCLLRRASLLRRLGKQSLEALDDARRAAQRLRDPQPALAQIERIEQGEEP
jgi:hypothetical protein